MIELFIFHLHILAGLHAFTKYWQQHSLKDAALAAGVVFLVFIVGWSIMGTFADVLYPDNWNTEYFSQDTLALIMLVIPESFFFYYFFIKN